MVESYIYRGYVYSSVSKISESVHLLVPVTLKKLVDRAKLKSIFIIIIMTCVFLEINTNKYTDEISPTRKIDVGAPTKNI